MTPWRSLMLITAVNVAVVAALCIGLCVLLTSDRDA
jgi:hypothetical protein